MESIDILILCLDLIFASFSFLLPILVEVQVDGRRVVENKVVHAVLPSRDVDVCPVVRVDVHDVVNYLAFRVDQLSLCIHSDCLLFVVGVESFNVDVLLAASKLGIPILRFDSHTVAVDNEALDLVR